MGREIEVKIPVTDLQYDAIFEFMMGNRSYAGISIVNPCDGKLVVKSDEYYSRFNSREERIAGGEPQVIRIRTEEIDGEKKAFFTIKRKSRQNGIELNQEDETFVEDAEVIRDMLQIAGYNCWFKKEKRNYGVHCTMNSMGTLDYHLELEEVNGMKYVEIEVTSLEGDADKIKASLNEFAECLGLDSGKKDVRSWVEIINGK